MTFCFEKFHRNIGHSSERVCFRATIAILLAHIPQSRDNEFPPVVTVI